MTKIISTEGMAQSIAADINGFGGILHCGICGNWEWVTDTAEFLANGWPKCCKGYTMSWVTNRLLGAEAWDLDERTMGWSRSREP